MADENNAAPPISIPAIEIAIAVIEIIMAWWSLNRGEMEEDDEE